MDELRVDDVIETPLSKGKTLRELIADRDEAKEDLKRDLKAGGAFLGLTAAIGLGISGLRPAGALLGFVGCPLAVIVPVVDGIELVKANKAVKKAERKLCLKK